MEGSIAYGVAHPDLTSLPCPGGYWKGPIGKVRVVFRFEDVLPYEIDSLVEPLFTQFITQDSGRDPQAALAALKELSQALQAECKAKHMEAELSEVASAIDLIEARYRFQLGQAEFGRGVWERELKGGNVNPQIYYYLGTLYHKEGRRGGDKGQCARNARTRH